MIYSSKREVTERLNCPIAHSILNCAARKHLVKTKISVSFYVCLEILKGINHIKGSEQSCSKLM